MLPVFRRPCEGPSRTQSSGRGVLRYLACLFAFAQRAFCAAAILARASGENTRFFVMTGALLPELPGPLL